ncbi:MAG: hypothetical protein N2689_04610, partial [Verrucomicrobiae bacterium]|nr:hypothetical protein [Verrucomicrobiae bacterium]
LLTLACGMVLLRTHGAPRLGRWAVATGGVLFLVFAVLVGGHFAKRLGAPPTPKNPGAPKPLRPLTGLPVFPGAEGFGTRTPAGRGGKVLFVTSLADSGPGTLREALNQPFPRIIVFRVGGIIALETPLHIAHPFVTVAGQTAPGDGILIKNCGLVISSHDVLIQHLRIRPGNEGSVEPDTNDAIEILGSHGKADGARNVVLDHVSAGWSEDETVSVWFGAHDISISWCIISEALDRSRHRKGRHSAGLLIGDGSCHVTVHHTLLAHNGFRNPLISGGGTHDIVNNVIYDWGSLSAEIVDNDSNSFLNFVGNCFIPGPSTEKGPYEILFNPGRAGSTPILYVAGNIGPHRPKADKDDWALVGIGFGREGAAPARFRAMTSFDTWPVTAHSAAEALPLVLAHAGATLPKRDAVDARVVADVRNRTGRLINSPREVGGYPFLRSGAPPADADNDGMPDEWERQASLDPHDPSDANKDRNGDGYTNIEEYLHSLLKETPTAP